MGRRSKRMDASNICFMVSILLLQSLSTPANCGRNIPEFSDQKNYYVPTTPQTGSPPNYSSPNSPACPTPSNGGSSGGGHSTPTTPSHGSGSGYHHAPPTSTPGTTAPSPPYSTPGTTAPSPPYSTPGITVPSSPPYSTPAITVPSPPLTYDPNVPPFHPGTCSYWAAHPEKIVVVIGKFGTTVRDFFGVACIFAYGKNPTLHDAVANTNAGGVGALLREGTTALLNSLACKSFPLTQQQVTSDFAAALGTAGSAAAQAEVFKVANEGRYNKS
ncbi:hypothetical protein KSP39_PZI013097 [Platanthera zijinensis]|uniref:Protodermal factor 1 n=1 Tax=Platanthera zijinensis TaxID=2320716 RepID=A0AAP0BDN3_9ASPA